MAAHLPTRLAVLLLVVAALAAAAQNGPLDRAQALLDQGQAPQALALLEKEGSKLDARGLYLRGTGRIMLGELKTGAADLEKSVQLDPSLRQAWLNLAGLEIAEGRFDKAHGLLVKARDLDPSAPDNHLNLGAVLMMMGRRAEAKAELEAYLQVKNTAEDYYLVAANFALGGQGAEAVAKLARAFELDERLRMRTRADDRFALLDSLEYKVLLSTDSYKPPPGAFQTAAAFKTQYQQDDEKLLGAVLAALRKLELRYEPEIEANAKWAIVQGELRIKLYNQENGTGVVAVSAPAGSMTAAVWQQRTQELFRSVLQHLGEL